MPDRMAVCGGVATPRFLLMYYVYMLLSLKDQNFYIGYTKDLIKRIKQHNNGEVNSTKKRKPLKLICYEAYLTKKESMAREKYLKSNNARKELRIRCKISIEKLLKS